MAKAKPKTEASTSPSTAAAVATEVPAKKKTAPIVEAPAKAPDPEPFDAFNLNPTPEATEPATQATPEADAAPSVTSSTETPPPADTPAPPVIHKHSRRLLAEARRMGFSEAEINGTPSAELDDQVYAAIQAEALRAERERQKQAAEPKAEPEPDLPFSDKDYEGWSAEVVEALKKRDAVIIELKRDQPKKMAELERKLAAIEQNVQQERAKSNRKRVEAKFKEYGIGDDAVSMAKARALLAYTQSKWEQHEDADNFESDFDEGAGLLGFAPTAAAPAAKQVAKEQPASPPPPPPAQEQTPEQKAMAERQEKWQRGGLPTPNTRTAIEDPPGEEKAIKGLRERHKNLFGQGLSPSEKEAELDDIFGKPKGK